MAEEELQGKLERNSNNDNGNNMCKNLWAIGIAKIRGKGIAINIYKYNKRRRA